MSKLDDIFDKYRSDCFLAKDAGLGKSTNMLAMSSIVHKQQVKDLMLEIIGKDEGPEYGIASLSNKAQVIGDVPAVYNSFKAELRQKVEEL